MFGSTRGGGRRRGPPSGSNRDRTEETSVIRKQASAASPTGRIAVPSPSPMLRLYVANGSRGRLGRSDEIIHRIDVGAHGLTAFGAEQHAAREQSAVLRVENHEPNRRQPREQEDSAGARAG